MGVKKVRLLSNIIIIGMFIALITYLGASNYSYVFSYQNKDVIYNGNTESNKVSIMFNVYWGTEYISDILKILDNYNCKATFFVGGQWVEKEPEKLREIFEAGHEIANHGYFHKNQENLNYDQNYEEIHINHELVKSIIGLNMNLFAPPSGSFNSATLEAAKNLNYNTIMWSKDTIDWRDKDANLIYTRSTNNLTGGDLILAHPTACTVKALPMILEYFKINNFSQSTVSECLK